MKYDPNLESQANELGIPMRIVIDDDTRYEDCVAHAAVLTSIEGNRAVYKGVCGMGHQYEMSYLISDLQAKYSLQLIDGEYTLGEDEDGEIRDLEEY